MMKSKKERAECAANGARDGTGPTDADVVRALRQVFEDKYAKSWGDKQAAVEAALRFMADNNCNNFPMLTEIVNTRKFAGKKGGMFVEAAVGAYLILLKSLQEKHEATMPATHKGAHKQEEGKPKTDEESNATHEKLRASEENGEILTTSVMPNVQGHAVLENAKAGGMSPLEKATQKATAEMTAQFNYTELCEQGKQLFNMVLQQKIKRIHSKMQSRLKKKGSLSPEI